MNDFWDNPETVTRFSNRKPDHRLIDLSKVLSLPDAAVLDLGCAAGRNTVWLAERGADVHALDTSLPMVSHTRSRLAPILGKTEAEARVMFKPMDDLSLFADASFDLVLGLGIFQQAANLEVWQRTLQEVSRVLKKDAYCLVANFGPDSRPLGVPLENHSAHVYTGFQGEQPMVLMSQAELDKSFEEVGLVPAEPSVTVRNKTELGYRDTVNALYQKRVTEG